MAQHGGVIKWKHFSRYWSFVRGIHRSPVNFHHKGQWRGALMFSLICAWTNGSVNYRDAGDWKSRRAHHDVTVMNLNKARRNQVHIWTCSISKELPENQISILRENRLLTKLVWNPIFTKCNHSWLTLFILKTTPFWTLSGYDESTIIQPVSYLCIYLSGHMSINARNSVSKTRLCCIVFSLYLLCHSTVGRSAAWIAAQATHYVDTYWLIRWQQNT